MILKPTISSSQNLSGTTFAGDLLLTFSANKGRGARSEAAWQSLKKEKNWECSIQSPSDAWKGMPFFSSSSDASEVFLLGEIYGPARTDLNNFCLKLLSGQQENEAFNGHFLILAWDGLAKEWHVWTDRFGTLHAYYATDGNRAAIGTYFPSVSEAASGRQLDWEGLSGFFGFGFFPQDKTYFKDVKILKPASHYVFNENGKLIKEERYWNWRHVPDLKRSYEDTVSDFAEIFHKVIAEQTASGRVAVPVSGGLDSRSTVAALMHNKTDLLPDRFWSYSYGYSDDSSETAIAGRIATAAGLPFQKFTIKPYLFDRLNNVLASVEGFQDITQCRQALITDQIAEHADYLLAAHWGDVWLDDMEFRAEGNAYDSNKLLEHTLKKISKNGAAWLLEQISQNYLKDKNPNELLRSFVSEELKKTEHLEDPDFRIKAFKTDQWSFRWTMASIRMFQPGAFPRLPFYDTRLTDFFCTVPTEFVRGRRLQIDYLKRFAPKLARITWQVYDADLFNYQHFDSWLLPKRALKKAWRILTCKRLFQRNWEVQFLSAKGRSNLEQWLLKPGLKLNEFFSPAAIKDFVNLFYASPEKDGGYTVSMLLTFSGWLEKYV